MTPSILIIEHQAAIQELLVGNLKNAGFLAVGANTSEEGLSLVRTIRPDLVVLDGQQQDTCGDPLIDTLRRDAGPHDLPLLILCDDAGQSIENRAGTLSFLRKPFSPNQLVTGVRALLNRCSFYTRGETLEIGTLKLNPLTHQVSSNGVPIQLRPTEFRLLSFFMAHPEGVYSRTQLLDEIWGDQVFISERAVDVQIRRLRAALEPYGHGQHLETLRGAGYRFIANLAVQQPGRTIKKPGSALRPPAYRSACA